MKVMTKPTVVHLIEDLTVGGAPKLTCTLVSHLREGRYDPLVCCLTAGPVKAEIEDRGVQVITLNTSRRSIVLFPLFIKDIVKTITALILLTRKRNVEIIQAHCPDPVILAGIIGKLSGVGVVATYHGLKMFPFDRKQGDPRNLLRRFFYRFAGKSVNRSIAVSEPIRDMLCRTMQVKKDKIVVINNGIDAEEYEITVDSRAVIAELGLDFNSIVITCIGRLVSNKGHKYLIMAAQGVIRYYPNAKFLLVGNGPTFAELTDLVSQLSLEKHVKFLGERSDIPNILAITNVFVLPSFAEGISIALLEAMAAGKPVVATTVPGNREVVVDKETGLLVPAKDFEALGNAICKLLAYPYMAKRMGAMGKVRVKNHFNVKETIIRIEQIYDEVIREKRSNRGKIVKQ